MLGFMYIPNKEVVMGKEEILILDDGEDSPISPMGLCCGIVYIPFRNF
jgi:hypothetical protein